MASPVKIVQTNTLYLSGSGVLPGATSVGLTTLTDIYGNTLTMTDFGSIGYFTLEPDTTNEEAAQFTGITANANGTFTLTGVSTVLAKSPYTATSGLVRQHSGGTKVVVTDTAGFWATFANKNNDETITGNWTFNTQPTSLSATPASTTTLGNVRASVSPSRTLGVATITIASPAVVTLNNHGLTANDTIQFTTTGVLPTGLIASTTYYVIATGLTTNTFQLSTAAGGTAINTTGGQSGIHTLIKTTPVGIVDTDYRLPENAYALDTGAVNAYVITLATAPSTYRAGQEYAFKATNSNTAASTLNINGLGAAPIIRLDGTSLTAGDISANGIATVIYDGTSFRLNASPAQLIAYQAFTSSGTWNKPTGLTGNEFAVVFAWGAGGGGGGGGSTSGGTSGGGGGGGAFVQSIIPVSTLGSSESVTVGAQGTAGAGAATGNTGGTGGTSLFGLWVTAFGGGAGSGTSGASGQAGAGGGGAGLIAAGTNASATTGGVGGGYGGGAASTVPITRDGGSGGGTGTGGSAGASSAYNGGAGGGSGGQASVASGKSGGSSVYGGGGGGGGGSTGGPQSPGAAGTSTFGGAGGAGGSNNGNGVDGVAPAGGGGGGGSGGGVAGNGGAGARGEVRVWVVKS